MTKILVSIVVWSVSQQMQNYVFFKMYITIFYTVTFAIPIWARIKTVTQSDYGPWFGNIIYAVYLDVYITTHYISLIQIFEVTASV